MATIKNILFRFLFVALATAAVVFFSEKLFWYVQGYAIFELVLYYAIPVSVCIWVLDLFQVQRLSGVVLVGGLLGFLVEGVLTPVVYEAGLLDPVMPAYFIGWHGALSFVFGFYLIRKWLLEKKTIRLAVVGSGLGLFWGVWSLSYQLPESILEFQALVNAGENWIPGTWPVSDFFLYTTAFTAMLMAAHWLQGQGIWQTRFALRWWEISLLGALLALIYVSMVLPVVPLGFLKLAALVLLILSPLAIQQRRLAGTPILEALEGRIPLSRTLVLLTIPLAANLVYGLAAALDIPEDWIRLAYESLYALPALFGAILLIWAWIDTLRLPGQKAASEVIANGLNSG